MSFKNWSTLTALAGWACSAFTAEPTIASFIVHFMVLPLFIGSTIYLAHHEGRAKNA